MKLQHYRDSNGPQLVPNATLRLPGGSLSRSAWSKPLAGLFAALMALSAGCGDEEPTVAGTADTGAGVDTDQDLGTADSGGSDDTSTGGDVLQLDTASDTDTAGDSGGTCPGAPGCACKEAKECETGFCVTSEKGQFCAAKCADGSCPDGQKCVQAGTTDVLNVCVPKFPFLCNPCNSNDECKTQASPDAKCIAAGNNGSYCGSTCGADADCPGGYSCSDVKDVTGSATKQCVPKDGAACSCSEYATAQQLSTKCYVATGDGKCEGKRTCLPKGATGAPTDGGLSACIAAESKNEVCDGSDNDCDGQTDEATCDDNNPCTTDACDGAAGCKNTANTGKCDADGSVCTEDDFCKEGKCIAGTAKVCDDKNPCTKDACDAAVGCTTTNDDGVSCDSDNNPCTVADTCKGGSCEKGKAKACDSDDGCMLGKCDIGTGNCTYKFQDGNPCNDGNPCTEKESCVTDACKGSTIDCDDKSVCTSDSCDPKVGCAHSPVTGACEDGDKCTEKDACAEGKCVGIAIDVTGLCDDKNPCTADSCDPTKGCVNTASTGALCDDGNPCTEGDACKAGKCSSDVNKCGCEQDSDCVKQEDGNLCNGTLYCDKGAQPYVCKVKDSTIVKCDDSQNGECQTNACDSATGKCGFVKKPNNLSCNADDSLCTVGDKCQDGKCGAGTVQTCNDQNPCTDDSCDPAKGCVFTPNNAPCDADDNLCTVNDACQQGTCVPGKAKACDSGDQCIIGKCNILDGKCAFKFQEGASCNDGSPCSVNDACKTDACTGSKADCNDNNPCTGDSCDPKSGCVHTPVPAGCDDGDKCTAEDACADGKCAGKPIDVVKACNDDNVCTTDSCDPKVGCSYKPAAGTCDDGNVCTVGDTCDQGACVSGASQCNCTKDTDCNDDGNKCNGVPYCDKSSAKWTCKTDLASIVVCDDALNTQCTSVACDTQQGKCIVTNTADGTTCDADGSKCTKGDACKTGKCTPGPVEVCDDKNVCTDDSCDAKTGCKFENNTAPCDADGNACTLNDKCTSGACVTGATKKCDDTEGCTQDTCDSKTGNCVFKPITTQCSDNNVCTTGDVCGTDPKTSAYTCLPGKAVPCDDQNVCTIDVCDSAKGCLYTVDTGATLACYTGPSGTKDKGLCKAGKQTCDSSGKLGSCTGEVVPAPKELCNGVDDTCNGVADEGCAPVAFQAKLASAVVSGDAGSKMSAHMMVGGSTALGSSSDAKFTLNFGFYAWFKKFLGL
jgi:hypothetical protein